MTDIDTSMGFRFRIHTLLRCIPMLFVSLFKTWNCGMLSTSIEASQTTYIRSNNENVVIYYFQIQFLFHLKWIVALICIHKVHIFWEGHKTLGNLHQLFDWQYIHRTNNWWRFRKILWPSQNIWTLTRSLVQQIIGCTNIIFLQLQCF